MSQKKIEFNSEKLPHRAILNYLDYYFTNNPYISVSFKGVCYGFIAKYIDALVLKEQSVFFDRLRILYKYQNDIPTLFNKIEALRTRLKGKTPNEFENLSYDEKNMLEIPAFLESIYIQQDPNKFSYIIKPDDTLGHYEVSNLLTQDFNKYHTFTSPLKLKNQPIIRSHKTIHVVTEDEFIEYLIKLENGLSNNSRNIGIVLHSRTHAIALSFNKIDRCWELLDINHLIVNDNKNNEFLFKSKNTKTIASKAYAYLGCSYYNHKRISIEFYQHNNEFLKKPLQPLSTNPYYQFFHNHLPSTSIFLILLSLIVFSYNHKIGAGLIMATLVLICSAVMDELSHLSEKTYDFFKSKNIVNSNELTVEKTL